MSLEIKKEQLDWHGHKVNALVFIPSFITSESVGLFTHGYTSHKGSILNWAVRLCEEGMPCVLFDQPGHCLGSYSEVDSFEQFKEFAHELFKTSHDKLLSYLSVAPKKLVIGGHSLGALTSLFAIEKESFNEYEEVLAVCVGLGFPPEGVTHIFNSSFYKSTLNVRAQLVSPHLGPDSVFPWIKEAKRTFTFKNKTLCFLTGEDDLIVGKDGAERMSEFLEKLGNKVILEKPNKMPHHHPEVAAAHIKKILKTQEYL